MNQISGAMRVAELANLSPGMSYARPIVGFLTKKLAETKIPDDELPGLIEQLVKRTATIRSTETRQRGSRIVEGLECAIVDLRARLQVASGKAQDNPETMFADRRPSER